MESLICADCVAFDLSVTSQKQLLQEMIAIFDKAGILDTLDTKASDIVSTAMDREKLGSTGVGNGVALPHARIDGLDKVYAAFARLGTPLDYNAVDARPVDLVAMLIAPSEDSGAHLRALAQISRRLRRTDMRARLRAAPDAQSLYLSLTDDTLAAA